MNTLLTDFTDVDLGNIVSSGSITSNYDDSGNLLMDKNGINSSDIAVSIQLLSVGFDDVKVESKYDVNISELI